ncbi:DUF4198 domain-containing protein [Sphingobacterium wenxiniae]|uniref:GH25 family protein n=1 Tax=Sphingobacterium wenxiniae TaxID=683125 RepID=A0A1I6NTY0_9SPHI|nr:DUF4198 domain-containing protein [Sphingobacterium wenxiniae]SFS31412.1 hypothetical protein SAMN05660206_101100 [Sphingobacterium wenxiniae]
MFFIKRVLLFLAIVLGGNQVVTAHAVWLACDPVGNPNQPHTVRVYYGEYATGELEETKDWYSDLRELVLYWVSPNGEQQTLKLEDKGQFLEGTFVPKQEGIYQLFSNHPTKDLGGETRFEFVAQASVQIGKSVQRAGKLSDYQLQVDPKNYTAQSKIPVSLQKDGNPIARQEILVMSEAGWSKTYKTDAQGQIQVDAIWPGRYVIEFGHAEEQEGIWNGKPYKRAWQGITTSFLVQ